MSNEIDIRSYRRITHNFSPRAQSDLAEAARIHETTQSRELMDALARNRKLAELEMLGLNLVILDSKGNNMGEVVFDEGADTLEEGVPTEFPPNVIPLHQDSY